MFLFVCLFLEVGLCINFPLRTAFAASHRFWVIMISLSYFSRNFLISLFTSSITCLLFRNVLFDLHVFVFYTVFFSSCNWYLVSALWSEKMLDMISVFLNLLILDLWTRMWSILGMFHVHLRRKYSPLQYSCQENPMDRGTWLGTVYSVAKETWLSD